MSLRALGWQRDLWRFLYKNRLEGRHWAVLEQDRIVHETVRRVMSAMVNDISGLRYDPGLAGVVRAGGGLGVVLHRKDRLAIDRDATV